MQKDVLAHAQFDLDCLKLYCLDEPPTSAEASLKLLDVGSEDIMIPLIATAYRAPTCIALYPSVVVWFYGRSGTLKSTLAALMLNHYGVKFSDQCLPGNWISTENALEKALSLAHDVPFVIDDYAPQESKHSADEMKRKAIRIIRAVGNRQARARLRSDTTGRPEYIPNALAVSTGELPPAEVESINARILLIDFNKAAIDMQKLTEAQTNRRQLIGAMHGYICWLAPQMDTLMKTLEDRFYELRSRTDVTGHKRINNGIIHIFLGWDLFLQYALDSGAVTASEKEELWQRGWNVFMRIAYQAKTNLDNTNPVNMFFDTLNELLIQGAVYIADKKTGHSINRYNEDFQKNAVLIGWADENYLYLMPDASMKAVVSSLRSMNIEFPLSSKRAFGDMLRTTGKLAAADPESTMKQVRVPNGGRTRVWQLPITVIQSDSSNDQN